MKQNPPRAPDSQAEKMVADVKNNFAWTVKFKIVNTDLSETTISKILGLRLKSKTVSDYIDSVLAIAKRTGSISLVNINVVDSSNFEIQFSRPKFYRLFTNSKGVNARLAAFGVFDFFDKAQIDLISKLTYRDRVSLPNSVKSCFSYTLPFNVTERAKFFKLSVFNVNTHKFTKEDVHLKAVRKGLELESHGLKASLYARERLEHSKDAVRENLTFRVIGKTSLIEGLGLDAKVSIDRSLKISHRSLIYSDKIAYINFKKLTIFIANNTALSVSSTNNIDPSKTQRFYNFNEERQKWSKAFTSYNRLGFVNKIGFIDYSVYLFGNLLAFQKPAEFGVTWNFGVGNRFLFSNNLAVEVLLNLNKRQNEKLITTKFLLFD